MHKLAPNNQKTIVSRWLYPWIPVAFAQEGNNNRFALYKANMGISALQLLGLNDVFVLANL
jgi:hypothetical protein